MKPAHRSLAVTVVALLLALAVPAAQAGVVAWWAFEGNTNDSGPNGYNGVVTDAVPTSPPTYVAGPVGQALNITPTVGDYDYVTIPHTLFSTAPTKFSVGFWLNPNTAVDYNQGIGRDWNDFNFHTTSNGSVYTGVNSNNASRFTPTQLPANTVQLSTWQYFTFTYDNGNAAFYKDGNRLASKSGMAASSPWTTFMIGADVVGSAVNGAVDEVAIWNQTLSPIDVKKLAAGGTFTPADVATYDLANVTYRIQVGSPPASTSGNTTVKAYATDDVDKLGSQFASTSSGSNQVTATGSVPWRVGMTDYFQVEATHRGTIDDIFEAPSVTAVFTAPMGYLWDSTNTQYLATTGGTGTPWTASSYQWENALYTHGDGGVTYVRTVPPGSVNPAPSGFPADANAQSIWGDQTPGDPMSPTTYLDVAGLLVPGGWRPSVGPEEDPGTEQGLSGHIVRTGGNIDNLTEADTALTLRMGGTDAGVGNHDASQVLTGATRVLRADIDGGGDFSSPAGYFPGDRHSTDANPEDYAMRLTGYVYAPSDDYDRTFAFSGVTDYSFTIGDISLTGGSTVSLMQLNFPQEGYYPFEILFRNRDGSTRLEASSMEGYQTAFSNSTFTLLGAETGTGSYFMTVERPAGVPVADYPDGMQAESAGARLAPRPTTPGTGDGFRMQLVDYGGNNMTYIEGAQYLLDSNPGVGVAASPQTVINFRGPTTGGAGNFGSDAYIPGAPTDGHSYATRLSGLVDIPEPGVYAFSVNSEEGFRLRVGSEVIAGISWRHDQRTGTANTGYAYFGQAGLYPVQLDGFADDQYTLEFAHGGFDAGRVNTLLLSSRNPSAAGFDVDWGTQVYSVNPVAEVTSVSTMLRAKIATHVPQLDGGTSVPVERWVLEKRVAPTVANPDYLDGSGNPIMMHQGL
ncbi:MAG TPA: LamG-like jellyroll fold domain-containing protein, partial [Phycisphaerae bacterium]|nr:LamG-like jellyroll fold domain-containing protein [Phycisphaerae bacterium]